MSTAHRYEQFCVVARAAEVLGHRWTPLLLRDLLVGPQRFSDLRRKQHGLTASVLTARLAQLERQGLVRRRKLSPPAASSVYELTPLGRATEPILLEMARFGVYLLGRPARLDDAIEPEWFALVVDTFGRRDPSPTLRFALRLRGGSGDANTSPLALRLEGGPDGTRRCPDDAPDWRPDLSIETPVALAINLIAGAVSPAAFRTDPDVQLEGDASYVDRLPELFEMPPPLPESDSPRSAASDGIGD